MKINFLIKLLFLLCLISCKQEPKEIAGLPYFITPDFTPQWIDKRNPSFNKIHKIQDFSLVNQNGEEVNNASFRNKIYVANFFFTICPGICPMMTENMVLLQNEYQSDDQVMFISHTVTPWIDSVAQLKKYAIEKGVNDSKYHLVTGTQEEIYNLARKSYFAEKEIGFKKEEDEFLHSENLLLIDQDGHIRGIYNGTKDLDIERLQKHIEILTNDKNIYK